MEHTPPTADQHEPHLFSEHEFQNYELASKGQRFVNYLIDAIIANYVIDLVTEKLLLSFFDSMAASDTDGMYGTGYSTAYLWFTILTSLFNSFLYYSICEKVFKGKTLGKLLTRTQVIRDDGQELTWGDTMLRSICRWVPFEALSIFFRNDNRMWHDAWAKTSVVKSR